MCIEFENRLPFSNSIHLKIEVIYSKYKICKELFENVPICERSRYAGLIKLLFANARRVCLN